MVSESPDTQSSPEHQSQRTVSAEEKEYHTLLDEYIQRFNDHMATQVEFFSIVNQHTQISKKVENILDVLALLSRVLGHDDGALLDDNLSNEDEKARLSQLIQQRPELGESLSKILKDDQVDESAVNIRDIRALMECAPQDGVEWVQRFTLKLQEDLKKYKMSIGELEPETGVNHRKRKLDSL